ncbi:lysozyme [Asticcacaulis sp. EMRT-3]|uniref:lysozyme n=1 Tax=Asticcacaulis sp. EMRT-3 TaxID=3040349 RepID=UPI0024AFF012|nr:lysozyme [Asticcacaulis sp. EMRT-3]MDI7775038.1 glycoside hydrolase family protein [Asticcacaulis sp. EMRT-3]
MRARLKVSRAGVELIKSFEGLRQTATRLPDGRWTLGYGHTFSAREGAKVTQEDADALLRFDLLPIVDTINNLVLTPLNQNQFDALVSFCFNIGAENFTASTVLKRINEGRLNEAAQAMDAWRSAEFNGQTYVLAPLIRRRAAEKSLFLTPETIDHASVMTLRPVEDVADTDRMQADMSAPEEGLGPVGKPASQAATARQVIDLSAYAPVAASPVAASPVAQVEPAPVVPGPVLPGPVLPATTLPEGVTPNVIREVKPQDEAEASADLQTVLQRQKDEQARREEAERQEHARQEAVRQAQALAEARAAEQARQMREAEERARIEHQQQEALRAAEAEKAEQARLEQARLELARLENERREREAAADAARLAAEKLAAAKIEAEKAEAARIDQEKHEAEQRDREAQISVSEAAQAAMPAPESAPEDAAEKARKAEAAAALMRLYSPYGGGTLGRPLSASPASQTFVQHSVIAPSSTHSSPIEIAARPEDLPPASAQTPDLSQEEKEGESQNTPLQDRPLQTFAPVTAASTVQASAMSALNPYARQQIAPQAALPTQDEPRPELNWREQLDRPLPQNHQPESAPQSVPPVGLQSNLQSGLGVFDESYGDDAGWTLDGGRIAMPDTDEPEHASWWTMIVSTFWWIFISGLGLGCLGVAAGAYYKSRDAVVIRNGAVPDYMTWSVVMAAVGILCVSVSLWLIMKRLGGLKD